MRTLTLGSARDMIRERSFCESTGSRVGVELEWFTTPSDNPPDVPTLERLLEHMQPLPCRSRLTFEPGGQVELSTPPFDSIGVACLAAETDSAVVRRVLADAGHDTFGSGFDPQRTHRLQTDVPRYVAMRRYFDAYGAAGGRMMCATGAIHVNVDGGDDEEGRRRWRAAHVLGPMLVAAFANSPVTETGTSGYKSSRMNAWRELDPTRTSPVLRGTDPAADWSAYALDANVMFIRSDGRYEPLDDVLSFAEWIRDGHPLGFPDADDLVYHLTTLFPPVRPHGHLELRMIDMLPDPWWRAALALTTTLVCDERARTTAEKACAPTRDLWHVAARCALEDPRLHGAAVASFGAGLEALGRLGTDAFTIKVAHKYVERFTARASTPADEQLAALGRPNIAEAI